MMRFTLSALLCALALPVPAHAAYTGPQEAPNVFTTAREVREYPVDDHAVRLEGHIVRRIDHDKYLFRDKTSAIRLEIDDNVLPAQDFDETALVRIFGEVDSKALDNPQIDVERIELLK